MQAYAGATVNITSTNGTFSNLAGNTVGWGANGGSHMTAILQGGTSTATNGILIQSTGSNTVLNFTINGLTAVTTNPLGSNAITVGKANGTNGTCTGSVTNNVITSSGFDGIDLNSFGASGPSTFTVTGNTISGVDRAISAAAGQGASSMNLTIQGNSIGAPKGGSTTSYAIELIAGTQSGDAVCVFANLGDMSPSATFRRTGT